MEKKLPHKANDPSPEETGNDYHTPVLLKEAVEGLRIKASGIYVDCTFGGGGHSREILKNLDDAGRLIAFDQDPDTRSNLPEDKRITFIPHNFRHLSRFLRLHKINSIDGLLADLGVSSHQFNEPGRGFSTRFDAAMDMRMDPAQELTAYEILERYSAGELQRVFGELGEVTNAKTLASAIVAARATISLRTISNFKSAVHSVVKGNPNKYFAQVFQALRIEVNDELGALKEMLQQVPSLLSPGGRAAIITFHSLEDRLVKNFFRYGDFAIPETNNPFINTESKNELRIITKKPVVPGSEEIKKNQRSRSAKLRIAEKIELN